MAEKTKGQLLREELFYKKKNAFEVRSADEMKAAKDYAVGYAEWLDKAKTEREAVLASVELLREAGYKEYHVGDKLAAGDRVYLVNRGKALFAIKVGVEPIEKGIRIAAAHVDSPRLDLKQHPLFENDGIGYFKTHYYGGVRKYQWATIPLALHGVVVLKGGETVDVKIGDEAGDPVFCITDLLPHLAKDQDAKPLGAAFTGEGLNIVMASSPYIEEDGTVTPADEKVKLTIMAILNEKYGITETDFMSAELSIIPVQNSADVGLDRWLIGGYGHDDRVCAYTALTALMDNTEGEHTVMVVLADKEETGSNGITGMQCRLLADLIEEIAHNLGGNPNTVRHNSICLSADVAAAYDPNYPEVYEKRNSALIHCGPAIAKYTGARGKGGTNDASAEVMAEVRRMLDGQGVLWQTAELGKVDQGGGGTVAMYIANHNIPTIDIGVPVLSMHAPFEVISKADLYETYKAFDAFCK
ncbi:MAG: aminopeptidase [Ruminococcaceae bacterium]|nr:aminopeptidase [Oscillospiraceae bacterium]